MKKAIILFLFLAAMFSSMAQSTTPDNPNRILTKQDYLEKSKTNKSAALVCLIGGGVLFLVGDIIALADLNDNLDHLFEDNQSSNHDALVGILVITGGAAMLSSIPLFRAAHKNKRIAMSMSFKNEPALQLQRSTAFYKSVPSVCLKISL